MIDIKSVRFADCTMHKKSGLQGRFFYIPPKSGSRNPEQMVS